MRALLAVALHVQVASLRFGGESNVVHSFFSGNTAAPPVASGCRYGSREQALAFVIYTGAVDGSDCTLRLSAMQAC